MINIFKTNKPTILYAPVSGEVIDLEQVPDKVFASKMMGEGIAFELEGDTIYAPVDGKITVIPDTKHAFGMIASNGAEILIHVGLDTVNLNGKGFEILSEVGKKVKMGTPIIHIDSQFMKENHVNLITPMVITNSSEFKIELNSKNRVEAKSDFILKCIRI